MWLNMRNISEMYPSDNQPHREPSRHAQALHVTTITQACDQIFEFGWRAWTPLPCICGACDKLDSYLFYNSILCSLRHSLEADRPTLRSWVRPDSVPESRNYVVMTVHSKNYTLSPIQCDLVVIVGRSWNYTNWWYLTYVLMHAREQPIINQPQHISMRHANLWYSSGRIQSRSYYM